MAFTGGVNQIDSLYYKFADNQMGASPHMHRRRALTRKSISIDIDQTESIDPSKFVKQSNESEHGDLK